MNIGEKETVYLDTVDGFGFEDLCAKIFDRLQWGKVERIGMVKDGGRDIVIHLPIGGSIVIECKHQPNTSIGRPIVQKLHSAVISSGAVKGILITTGKFSNDAIEHAHIISSKTPIDLFDLNRITDLADRAGIKLLFSGSYSPIFAFPSSDMPGLADKMKVIFEHFQSFPKPASEIFHLIPNNLKLEAKYVVRYDVHDSYSTTIGLIDSIDITKANLIVDANNSSIMDPETENFLQNSVLTESSEIPILACPTRRENFSIDKTTLSKMVKNNIIQTNTRSVSYRGRNNVRYQKTWQPGVHSISIIDVKQVLLPRYDLLINAINQRYKCTLIQNSKTVRIISTDVFQCKVCMKTIDKKLLLCNDCGKVTHAPKLFRSHGFRCKDCNKTICRDSAYWTRRFLFFKKIMCEACANIVSIKTSKTKRKLDK